ncbi:MAG TPA: type II secretion system protein [Planctomycetota bacterium]|nr:type II secretion system protein [Planctomycetota bacterium]
MHLKQDGCSKPPKGLTLIEVMIATAIVGIMCTSVLTVMYKTEQTNRFCFQYTTAVRAAHQAMEILQSEDLDTLRAQDGLTFAVLVADSVEETGGVTMDGLSGADLDALIAGGRYALVQGTVSVTDLGWGGADKAYQITVAVPTLGVTLTAVRARI